MESVLTPENTRDIVARLAAANLAFARVYPGERADRQPVHTVYGGAHLFTRGVAGKLGSAALRTVQEFAPDFQTFAAAVGLPGAAGPGLAQTVYRRMIAKLEREPVEDLRIDFEDGYGNRPDAEEDGHAAAAAEEMAAGLAQRLLPPFIGIRIKPFTEELRERSVRTLDIFVSTLAARSGGALPSNFVITLPKVTVPEQVEALAELLSVLEQRHGLPAGALRVELMVETPQSIIGPDGRLALPALVAAARGRCRGAHFGTYDYTASCNLVAAYQTQDHPACDFARHVMQVSLAGTGVTISDGATTLMPVGPHRPTPGHPLTEQQLEENTRAVRHAWRVHFDDVQRSLRHGYYQGWDLNPGQFPTRYAAAFAFFLEGLEPAAARLQAFVEKAAQATLMGNIFDDAATGQGLLNFFLRGINCGALTEEEALVTGLSLEELRGRSFVKILKSRRGLE